MMLEHRFVYILSGATSVLLYFLATRKLRLKRSALLAVLRELAECVGASAVFFAINMAIGMVIVFAIRGTLHFLPLYVLLDSMLVSRDLSFNCGCAGRGNSTFSFNEVALSCVYNLMTISMS